jgi:membrane dipeptidase
MIIVDAHLDLAWNALQWERDLRLPVATLRTLEGDRAGKGRGLGTVALPDLRRGRVAVCFATLLARSTGRPAPGLDHASAAQAFGIARGQLAYYVALEREGHIRMLRDRTELDVHVDEWLAWDAGNGNGAPPPPLGVVLSMEGVDPVLAPAELDEWWEAGIRLLGLTHYGVGRYAGGTGTETGLGTEGNAMLAAMERLGIPLDLTHCSDPSFWAALEAFSGPVFASHNNCRALVSHQRQFSDVQLRAIIERGGVIGVALDCWMLKTGWVRDVSDPRTVTLERVVDHIVHICELAGGSAHVAIGSDLDGGFGREQSPGDLDTIADLQKLRPLLARRGFGEADIAAIFHGNWLAFLRRVWREARV